MFGCWTVFLSMGHRGDSGTRGAPGLFGLHPGMCSCLSRGLAQGFLLQSPSPSATAIVTHLAKLLPFPSCHISEGTRWLSSGQSLEAFRDASTAPVPGVPGLAWNPSPAPNFLDGCWRYPQGCLWPRQSGYSGPSSPGPERTAHRCPPIGGGRSQVLHQFNRYLLSIYHVPGTTVGSGDAALNRNDNSPCPHGALNLALTTPLHLEME